MRTYNGEKIAILGASRGLGKVLAETLIEQGLESLLLVSRRLDSWRGQPKNADNYVQVQLLESDLTKDENLESIFRRLVDFNPHRIFYIAGGGSYGKFHERDWKDHQWALDVNLMTPAKLIHRVLEQRQSSRQFENLSQLMVIGSAIAGLKPDPYAGSYSAAKHALVGLIGSLQSEGHGIDLRLYNPGYINTSLLPKNAKPRHDGSHILEPKAVADHLLSWLLDENKKNTSFNAV